MTYKHYVYSGSGNRFLLSEECLSISAIRLFCAQVKVDGFLLLESCPTADAKLTIFNSDGSCPAMCGNGLRCVIAHLSQKLGKSNISVITDNGRYSGTFYSWNRISVDMTLSDWKFASYKIQHEIQELPEEMFFIDTGVPHLVLFVSEIFLADIDVWGRSLRYHPKFFPEGVNVDFVEILENQQLRLRTYERGLERESVACGTGAVAAALVAVWRNLLEKDEILVHMSMENVKILFDTSHVFLDGSVVPEHVYSDVL
ncbi:diaminopimelate epimerase [Chlamydia sp. 17-3921]|uniref:diaminopimelate epimerase n=1 Tax=Chlamydia sp. 17-3921 TaxID=2675798 RepID=UPI001918F652|nr:diaminopimelate epimerase [Chlamydia sp. 17-3921]